MSIAAKETLKTLEILIDKLDKTEDVECIQLCMTIEHILDKLEFWAENSRDVKDKNPCCNSASLYITEMKMPLYCIAGISDYGHDKIQCIVWLKSGIRKLSSASCFSINA
ncbi:hypothetical protein JWG39_15390 [Desulforhopalus vacuolatus]|uniref:hypothetical protein n=1 Tax=Desulforhopalus vacuolatus TaxID=40414 RepID=UPI001963CFAE|nr:hypothetical protein [Desulforhopalus vacuolatus]MBM9521203.1 hypothetical protein [Desulforhopalus vacuolatus]